MNPSDKQMLWTKYYLTHFDKTDSLLSLQKFVKHQMEAIHIHPSMADNKRKKIIRYMLKSLSKKYIIKKYCKTVKISLGSSISKNQLINRLVINI